MMYRYFSLRFYRQTEDKVGQCVAEMQSAKYYVPQEYSIEPGSVSANSGHKPSHQVDLICREKKQYERIAESKALRGIYLRYASGTQFGKSKLVVTKPSDAAWKHAVDASRKGCRRAS